MVAEKFEPLIGAGAIARTLKRGNMRQRASEQRDIAKTIADAGFQRGAGAAAAARLLLPVLCTVRGRNVSGEGGSGRGAAADLLFLRPLIGPA